LLVPFPLFVVYLSVLTDDCKNEKSITGVSSFNPAFSMTISVPVQLGQISGF
jgi:hypothetical protein